MFKIETKSSLWDPMKGNSGVSMRQYILSLVFPFRMDVVQSSRKENDFFFVNFVRKVDFSENMP